MIKLLPISPKTAPMALPARPNYYYADTRSTENCGFDSRVIVNILNGWIIDKQSLFDGKVAHIARFLQMLQHVSHFENKDYSF